MISSESCSFHVLNVELFRDVLPGEIVEISSQHGLKSLGVHEMVTKLPSPRFCLFEYVYFLRSDSILETFVDENNVVFPGQQVYSVRQRCGAELGKEAPPPFTDDSDKANWIVSTVPDSATPAAIGYARETGIPYGEVLSKNRYEGRSFIQPDNDQRKQSISRKFAPLNENYKGKSVILIDDSIVRGNTMKPIVALLKSTGATEVHLRIASPPLRYPCYMGINIPTKSELIANKLNFPTELKSGENLSNFAEYLKADSVAYLSLKGLIAAVNKGISKEKPKGYCTACLNGDYPVQPHFDW